MTIEEQFKTELDKIILDQYRVAYEKIVNLNIKVLSLKLLIELNSEFLSKYNFDDKLKVIVKMTPDENPQAEFFYNDIKIEPEDYYLRPANYQEISLLRKIQEAYKQDTYKPDIKFLNAY